MKYPPILPTTCTFCSSVIYRRKTKSGMNYCNTKCKAEWQKTQKPVSREWLVEHYIDKKMDCVQIGKIVKRDPKSVWNWLKDFAIPTRKRGEGWSANFIHGSGPNNAFYGKTHSEESRKRMSEIAKAQGRVPYDPKVGSYMKGKRGESTTNWKGGISPERPAHYASDGWKKAVKEVWKRDNATCQRCKRHKSEIRETPFDIHHIVSFQNKELRSEVSNLVLLCEPCHYWVHSRKNKNREFIK